MGSKAESVSVADQQSSQIALNRDWNLEINVDSKQCMTARGGLVSTTDVAAKGWHTVATMKTLGFILTDDGSIEPAWAHVKRSVWKA